MLVYKRLALLCVDNHHCLPPFGRAYLWYSTQASTTPQRIERMETQMTGEGGNCRQSMHIHSDMCSSHARCILALAVLFSADYFVSTLL